jgi:hypothetical protein
MPHDPITAADLRAELAARAAAVVQERAAIADLPDAFESAAAGVGRALTPATTRSIPYTADNAADLAGLDDEIIADLVADIAAARRRVRVLVELRRQTTRTIRARRIAAGLDRTGHPLASFTATATQPPTQAEGTSHGQ